MAVWEPFKTQFNASDLCDTSQMNISASLTLLPPSVGLYNRFLSVRLMTQYHFIFLFRFKSKIIGKRRSGQRRNSPLHLRTPVLLSCPIGSRSENGSRTIFMIVYTIANHFAFKMLHLILLNVVLVSMLKI